MRKPLQACTVAIVLTGCVTGQRVPRYDDIAPASKPEDRLLPVHRSARRWRHARTNDLADPSHEQLVLVRRRFGVTPGALVRAITRAIRFRTARAHPLDVPRGDTVLLGDTPGGTMIDDMGSFRINVEVENPAHPGERRAVQSVLIDTGAELSVFPAALLESLGIRPFKELRFRQADGSILTRWIGAALIYAAGTLTTDDVVFGESSDLILLGARSLEGLNVRIDPVSKRLVDAGPMPLAVGAHNTDVVAAGWSGARRRGSIVESRASHSTLK
jgi:predicted aspartyl protease